MDCNLLSILNLLILFSIIIITMLFVIKMNLYRITNRQKLLIFEFAIFFIAMISWPFMLLRPKDYRNLLTPFGFLRKVGIFLGYEVEIRGKENIKQNDGAVVIINHQSTLDLLLLSYLWPLLGRTKIVVKKSLLFYPFFGLVLWLAGFLFINRSSKTNAYNKLEEEIIEIQQKKCKLLLFPEGTRTLSEKFKQFRKGAFHTAIKSQCPIQPIVFSQYKFLRTEPNKCSWRNHLIINILPEIQTQPEYKNDEKINELIEICQNKMQLEFNNLNMELK